MSHRERRHPGSRALPLALTFITVVLGATTARGGDSEALRRAAQAAGVDPDKSADQIDLRKRVDPNTGWVDYVGEDSRGSATAPVDPATQKFVDYYLDMYGKHLESPDWIARAMAVIGLGKIDHPQVTEKLVDIMLEDSIPIVRVYAWEALHGRLTKLSSDQRVEWERSAWKLASMDGLQGDLRLGILGIIGASGPTASNKERWKILFQNTNSMDSSDIRTLWAMGDMLKRWQSPELIKGLIAEMSDLNDAYRAELVLRRISTEVPQSSTLRDKGSAEMWRITQERWKEWFARQTFEEIDPGTDGPYRGLSELMPHGKRITDTRDEKWRKDLELKRVRLDQLDVGFAIDSTGSMGQVIKWIQRDVVKMMRAFQLVSREPRIGVTLYRDHGDAYVVRSIPLSGNAEFLAEALSEATAKGGGDVPEAIYESLVALVTQQRWTKSRSARKVIVLVGDAPPHKDSLDKIYDFVEEYRDKGFRFYAIKVRTRYAQRLRAPNYDPHLETFDRIAELGGGQAFWVNFLAAGNYNPRNVGTAQPSDAEDPERKMFNEVLKAVLETGYSDRVEPFNSVLLEYVERPMPEKRKPFPPRRPRRRGPHKPHKPHDPQAR